MKNTCKLSVFLFTIILFLANTAFVSDSGITAGNDLERAEISSIAFMNADDLLSAAPYGCQGCHTNQQDNIPLSNSIVHEEEHPQFTNALTQFVNTHTHAEAAMKEVDRDKVIQMISGNRE